MRVKTMRDNMYRYDKVFFATLMILIYLFFSKITAYAAEFTVTEANAVLYTAEQTTCFAEPDFQAAAVAGIDVNFPIAVTGITSNGWFRIDLNGVYYVPGYALTDSPVAQTAPAVPSAPAYVIPAYAEELSYVVNTVEEAVAAREDAHARQATKIIVKSRLSFNTIFDIFAESFHYGRALSYGAGTANSINVRGGGGTYTITYGRFSTLEEEVFTDAMVAQLLPQFNKGTTYDKIMSVHDYICNNVSYSFETVNNQADFKSAYDALVSKTTVCSGYALLFQKFMDQLGIPCYYTTGVINGVGHGWNIVQLDGRWYHIDCTNADQSYGIYRGYFLKGASYAGPTWGNIALSPTDYVR